MAERHVETVRNRPQYFCAIFRNRARQRERTRIGRSQTNQTALFPTNTPHIYSSNLLPNYPQLLFFIYERPVLLAKIKRRF